MFLYYGLQLQEFDDHSTQIFIHTIYAYKLRLDYNKFYNIKQ